MMHVAIITGGPSAERSISEKSAALVEKFLNPHKYHHRTIVIEDDGWYDKNTGIRVNLNDFSVMVGDNLVRFDFAFLMIHGTPAEDGKIQGYFEMMKVPHSTCNTLSSALTFNKQVCKDYLEKYEIPMGKSILLRKSDNRSVVSKIPVPVFVKPNKNGSSYGVTKVIESSELNSALDFAFQFDDEVMVEEYLQGREFGCGVLKEGEKLHVFPVTELISENEFFDFEAKYEGASQEITPAEISEELTDQCQSLSIRLYQLLNCKGVVRFDYILRGEIFHLLEANTIPGMSEASIVPQQAVAYGWSIEKLLDVIIEDCLEG